MKYLETKYLLWYYGKQPKNKFLDRIGDRLHRKLIFEQEKEYLKSK